MRFTQSKKTAFPKGILNMLRRVLCFPKDTCQNLTDISSVEKYLASTISHRVSLFVDTRKQPCYAYFFNSLGCIHSKVSHIFFHSHWFSKTKEYPALLLVWVLREQELTRNSSVQELNKNRRRVFLTLASDGNFYVFWKILSMKYLLSWSFVPLIVLVPLWSDWGHYGFLSF